MVDGPAGDHQAGVQRSSGDAAQRVPCSVIEPIPEIVESIGDQVLCCSEVEPRVDYLQGQHFVGRHHRRLGECS